MLYVSLALVALLAVVVVVFAGLFRWAERTHARREDLLVNQLCNLAGTPWQAAPAQALRDAVTNGTLAEAAAAPWTTSPEQDV